MLLHCTYVRKEHSKGIHSSSGAPHAELLGHEEMHMTGTHCILGVTCVSILVLMLVSVSVFVIDEGVHVYDEGVHV